MRPLMLPRDPEKLLKHLLYQLLAWLSGPCKVNHEPGSDVIDTISRSRLWEKASAAGSHWVSLRETQGSRRQLRGGAPSTSSYKRYNSYIDRSFVFCQEDLADCKGSQEANICLTLFTESHSSKNEHYITGNKLDCSICNKVHRTEETNQSRKWMKKMINLKLKQNRMTTTTVRP